MTAYIIKRDDGDVVGYITDRTLAEKVDGLEAYYNSYDYHVYETEEVPNEDVF